MAHLLGVESVRATVGPRILLDDVNLGIEDGDRVGVLGPNGAGKSTLLALLAGTREPDSGRVTRAGDTRAALLSQSDRFAPEATVRTAVHGAAPEHAWASDPAVRDIHAGLLADLDLDAPVSSLSGGQRRRVALAAVLTADADLVILDEPTNHLDVEGVDWLARHLSARFSRRRDAGALVTVTHDRWFLDAVCNHVWEVVPGVDPGGNRPQIPGRVETYDGGYAAYVLARAERARLAATAAAKRENLLRKELAWLRRGAPARTSKPRFRIDAAEALIADVPPPRDTVELAAMATARLGKKVIDLEDVSVDYPDPAAPTGRREVLRRVTWRLAPGERVGIVGVNGAGKTTLLRLLEGTLAPTRGRVVRGQTVAVATLSQTTHELDPLAEMRVVDAVAMVGERTLVAGKELTAAQLVERLGFTRSRAWTRVGEISGGERRRLQLLRLLMGEPNVLLLDEPTNDLDTDTLAAIEDLLDSFPGTLVVVSHDRYLLERVTDHQVALLGDGALQDLPGGVEQYLQLRREASDAAQAASRQSHSAPAASARSGAALHAARKELARVERRLEKTTAHIDELNRQMELASAQVDVEQLTELGRQLAQAEAEREELEAQWLQAAEAAEY
ncbi:MULTISPECIES: ABC-F family ATP-binding cassette domain-containing protein [unclassified Actinomyces]|uniref:ABC-F family ATP-binding cassette domain-containing protein n=1 Tax=unclassified Actinomyces TaxID=2609248 RepID=UPI000D598A1B|nr:MULTISPECIES: ABC-F family ATP-binding cassette domain-containing protein [unclassified Actinomyces]RAX18954.1 ABC transporter ATP-binding protein [Actinomyces sp. Z5]RAX24458.1 ABC transporter ATP-binding protein [Actinomyces sp. Z3]